MRISLNPEELAIDSVVIGPGPEESFADSVIWRTDTQPMPVSNTACTSCYA